MDNYVSRKMEILQDEKDNTEDQHELEILNKLINILEEYIQWKHQSNVYPNGWKEKSSLEAN